MPCDQCGHEFGSLGYTCSKCGEEFCTKHRLPESHDCTGLKVEKAERELKRMEGETTSWFKKEKQNESTQDRSKPSSTKISLVAGILILIIAVLVVLYII